MDAFDGHLAIATGISAGTPIAANVKASGGNVFTLSIGNNATTPVWVRLYNLATVPAANSTPFYRDMIPGDTGGGSINRIFLRGIGFPAGIGIVITAAAPDNDVSAVPANQVVWSLGYQ